MVLALGFAMSVLYKIGEAREASRNYSEARPRINR